VTRRHPGSRLLRAGGYALLALGVAACTQTMRDYFSSRDLPPLSMPIHKGLEDKAQCMHCHTGGMATAPAVPHPEYKRCGLCHEVPS